ncbi:hypothetical protein C8Q80DRAFT_182975 [Daedaleopsis nitida]|nr:hypothetical protein C8Q80DRAFT_182975 [Daedaleopsis nitida]
MSSSHSDLSDTMDLESTKLLELPQGPTYDEITPSEFFRTLKVAPIVSEKSRIHRQDAQQRKRTIAGRRGKLTQLMAMPLDVFLMIASHLHPSDLLHLSRSSKMCASILLQGNRGVWNDAFKRIGLPPCPEDLRGPVYAALVFDRSCFACGVNRSLRRDIATRTRFCNECYEVNLGYGNECCPSPPGPREKLALSLLPVHFDSDDCDSDTKIPVDSHTMDYLYYLPEALAVLAYLQTVPEKALNTLDVNERRARVQQRITHAVEVEEWMEDVCNQQRHVNNNTRKTRKAKIMAELKALGYKDNDYPVSTEWRRLINQPKEVTTRVWQILRPKLENLIAEEKQRRVHARFMKHKNKRLKKIGKYYEAFIERDSFTAAERALMPNMHTAMRLPVIDALAVKDNARGPVPRGDFFQIRAAIRTEAAQYNLKFKQHLADHLRKKIGPQPRLRVSPSGSFVAVPDGLQDWSPDEVLAHPCALFTCRFCPGEREYGEGLPYPETHAHFRDAHPEEECQWDVRAGPWNKLPSTFFDVELVQIQAVKDILSCVGLSQDTPQADLDELIHSGRLYCGCGDPSMPHPEALSWYKLVVHVVQHRNWHEQQQGRMSQLAEYGIPGYREQRHLVYIDDHAVSDPSSGPFNLLPEDFDEDMDPSAPHPGFYRFAADAATRDVVKRRLAEASSRNYRFCRLCKSMTRYSKKWESARLPESVDEVVWHFRSKHGKEKVTQRDILF